MRRFTALTLATALALTLAACSPRVGPLEELDTEVTLDDFEHLDLLIAHRVPNFCIIRPDFEWVVEGSVKRRQYCNEELGVLYECTDSFAIAYRCESGVWVSEPRLESSDCFPIGFCGRGERGGPGEPGGSGEP